VKGAAPNALKTKAKTLASAFNRVRRTGTFGGSTPRNNPVQSAIVKRFLIRYTQRVAKCGFEAAPRDIINTRVLAQAMIECSRRVTCAQATRDAAQEGSTEQHRAAHACVLWAQMGAVCTAAHYRGQRGQSMAEIRARSVACWTGADGSRIYFLNALLTKTRRTGRKSTLVMPNRRSIEAHICPVAWYDRYCAALKSFGVYDKFTHGSFFFCKVWTDSTGGTAQRRVDPLSQGVVQTWSTRLRQLCSNADTGTQTIGMSGLRGGGAVAGVLTNGRQVADVMQSAEWSSLSTFRLYTQFHAVFAGAAAGPSEAAPAALSDLVDSFTEADYEAADNQTQLAEPFAKSATGRKD
jgi:hypothetical protein